MAAPMCRNRTDQFLTKRRQLRGSSARQPPPRLDDRNPLMDAEMGGGNTYAVPEWVDVLDEIREVEMSLKESLKELSEQHRKRLVPTSLFGGKDDSEAAEIQMLTARVTAQFKKQDAAVKRLTPLIKSSRSEEEKTTITNVQMSLATQLTEMSKQFRELQKAYLKSEKERKKKSKFHQSEEAQRWEEEDQLAQQEEELRMKNLTPEQAEMMKLTNDMLSQRDTELQDIVKSLLDIQSMFEDLNMMVIDQGTMLDRIDNNVSNAQAEVEGGVKYLQKSVDKSRHTRFKACVCLLLVLIIFFLIALIATKKRQPDAAPSPPSTPLPTPMPSVQ